MNKPITTSKKSALEVTAATRERVRKAAKTKGSAVKDLTALLLGYALDKLEAGQITVINPSISEKGAASV